MRSIFLLIVVAALPAFAAESPYAGQESRTVKSLSESEVAALQAGDGMGFARAAELNGYPGPKHVLELSRELELTPEQEAATSRLFEEMLGDASQLGKELVAAETALDREFASGKIDEKSLEAALLEIGGLRARLRNVHLRAHLRQKTRLTDRQVSEYETLRGYDGSSHEHSAASEHHP